MKPLKPDRSKDKLKFNKNTKDGIYQVYKHVSFDNRDELMLEAINQWTSRNIKVLADGIVNDIPVFSSKYRDELSSIYNISVTDWKLIQERPEFKKMKNLANRLSLGLIISYIDTKNKIYLLFLWIIIHSSKFPKYFTRGGYNHMLMKYTIDNADPRTDFKQLGSLSSVLDKILGVFINQYGNKLLNKTDDQSIRLLLQHSHTRINGYFKRIYNAYKTNYNDPKVKIFLEHAKAGGESEISLTSYVGHIREKSINGLLDINNRVLSSTGIINNLKLKAVYMSMYKDLYETNVRLTNFYLDEWLNRNSLKPSIDLFGKTWMNMKVARNLDVKNEILDDFFRKYPKYIDDYDLTVNELSDLRLYITSYIIINVFIEYLDYIK